MNSDLFLNQVYELEKREKEEKMTAILMFAVEALKIKKNPGDKKIKVSTRWNHEAK